MYNYSMTQWVFLFYFYCFLGWCVESSYVSMKQRPLKWINRGFMRGPFLPLYGSGAIMMLVVSAPFQHSLWRTYIAGCIGATVLEYVTGVTMEALFKVRYWDYSEQPFNFQGHICLGTTLSWGFLTIGMTRFLHTPVEQLMYAIPGNILSILVFLLTVYIVADFALSFKTAMDIRDILVAMEKIREEMERMQRRLDVIAAVTEEEVGQRKAAAEMKLEEISERMEKGLNHIRYLMQTKPGEYMEATKREALELANKVSVTKYRISDLKNVSDRLKRSMIMGNPTMRGSVRFKQNFEELKNTFREKLNLDLNEENKKS